MTLKRVHLWVFWLVLATVWFGTLDHRSLIRPDEGRYAEIPREMAVSGDWLTPRLNAIKYFEKPALQYWATAAGFKLFGKADWTARLWPALTGFLGLLLTWFTTRRLWGERAALLASAIQASTLLYLAMGQIVTLDMGLSFFMQLAWSGFILAASGQASEVRRWMWVAWAALGLAVLSKGLVAIVLTGGTLVAYTLLNRDLTPWRRLTPVSGLLLFLLVTAPWFIAVSLANPEFARFFFIHEHFERFLTTAHRRYQPGWYFLEIYLLGALPWTLLLLHALFKSWRDKAASAFHPQRFLLVWVLVTMGFFSLSSSKLPPYIVPIFPALAMLGGKLLGDFSRRALLIHLGLLGLLALPALVLAPQVVNRVDNEFTLEMLTGYATWLTAAAVLWALTLVAAGVLAWRHRATAALLVLAAGSLPAGLGILLGHENLSPAYSSQAIARVVKPLLTPGVPFYSIRSYEQTLPFYIDRTLTLVEFRGEMKFGIEQEPDKWIPTVQAFRSRWAQDRDAFAIMQIDILPLMQAEGMPMQEIARDKRYVIVRKVSPSPIPRPEGRGNDCSAATVGRPCESASS